MNSKDGSKQKDTDKKSGWLEKLKSIRHFDIVIIIVFVCILLMIYFSDSVFTDNTISGQTQSYTSYYSYTVDLEKRLSDVLGDINGVGKISVMITLDSSPELIIAYNIQEEKNAKDGSVTTKKDAIIITKDGKSTPLILSEKLPAIKGVVVVAQGANNISVKMNIISATTKLLDIPASAVEIFAGN